MKSASSSGFYQEIDTLFVGMEKVLSNHGKSEILNKKCLDLGRSFFYATIINNFFTNLNNVNVKDLKLTKGKIGQIKTRYRDLRGNVRLVLHAHPRAKMLTVEDYEGFKCSLATDFSGFQKILLCIEEIIDFIEADKYFAEKATQIEKSGKPSPSSNEVFKTAILEFFVKNKKRFLSGKELTKLKKSMPSIIGKLAANARRKMDKSSEEMLVSQRKTKVEFENHLYKDWKVPIDLLECLVRSSFDCGEKQIIKIASMPDAKSNYKYEALTKIHARALQISNEILVLLKSGYPDGANSRWRSLYELSVISFFLYNNNSEVSKRFLDHEIIKKFKEALDYKNNYKKLGHKPLSRKDFNKVKREKERLCTKYNDRFQDEYGWIPSSLLANRSFRALENTVKMNKFRPFYNLSCDAVHGGSKGFYRLGLKPNMQNKVLLVGPSNYGLADPLQNTAISLSQITVCFLGLIAEFENAISAKIILSYPKEIQIKATNVQNIIGAK